MLLLCALAALVLLVSAVAHTQGQGDIEQLTLDDVSDETIGLAPAKPAPPPENARPAEPSKPVETTPAAEPSKPVEPNSPVTPVETTPAAEPDWLTETTRTIALPPTPPSHETRETTQPMASPAAQLSPDTTDATPPSAPPAEPPSQETSEAHETAQTPEAPQPTTRPINQTGDEPPPGLAEATGNALTQVMDAARRDGASWAQRVTEIQQHMFARVGQEWNQLLASPVPTIDRWLASAGLPNSKILALPALGAVAVLVLLLKLMRGKGDLNISIEYPAELRGTFSVRIARKKAAGRKGPRSATPAAADRARRGASASNRRERHLVSRETDFREVLTGRWYVTVDGFMQPPDEEAVIGSYFEEQEIQVRRGHTARLDFDFRPKQCPVDVKVLWDKQPVAEALVAWRGEPD